MRIRAVDWDEAFFDDTLFRGFTFKSTTLVYYHAIQGNWEKDAIEEVFGRIIETLNRYNEN